MQTPKPFLKPISRTTVRFDHKPKGHTINPNSAITDAKISTINTLTNKEGSAASARAALLPTTPTLTPQAKLHSPTVNPAQNNAYPVK